MTIKEIIKGIRLELGETQYEFAKRFNTTANTISLWEKGTYQIPNNVIDTILEEHTIEVICPNCMGSGMVTKLDLKL